MENYKIWGAVTLCSPRWALTIEMAICREVSCKAIKVIPRTLYFVLSLEAIHCIRRIASGNRRVGCPQRASDSND